MFDQKKPDSLYKLQKSLYGLKQKHLDRGVIPSNAYTSLFILNRGATVIYMLVYVNDSHS
jgi:hypothetical protein